MTKKSTDRDFIRQLRGIGHRLSPIVTIGASGLTQSVIEETIRALDDHELIKVKIPAGSADERKEYAHTLANATESIVAHHIGRMVLLYRKNNEPNAKLSNLSRFGL